MKTGLVCNTGRTRLGSTFILFLLCQNNWIFGKTRMSTPLDKVRVLIVGDSETGKTSLSQLIAHGTSVERPMSTIGCSAQVKLHDYRAGSCTLIIYQVISVCFFIGMFMVIMH